MKKKTLVLTFIFAAGCSTTDAPTLVAPPTAPSLSVTANTVDTLAFDYAYTGSNSPHQRLDVFRPHGAVGLIPAVVCIHGGGWANGDKSLTPISECWNILAHGMAIVSINYRLSGDSVWPAQMHDVFTAIRCLRSRAGRYGIDSARIGVMGSSAGAHLAMIAGISTDSSLLGLSLGCKNRRSDVKAVVSLFGPTAMMKIAAELLLNGCPPDSTAPVNLMALLGLTTYTTREDSLTVMRISPVNNIGRVVPMQMWNGDLDCTVPYEQMTNMSTAMARHGGDVETNIAHGLGHGFKSAFVADSASSFLYRILTR